ncbi:MAG: ATP-binding protein [Methanomassiliicoccales archaeon]|nr:ATP-binding protein [Methanomassiliicoccales archaeon]
MIRIAVMSGKGGTGKTTAVASMAWYSDSLVLADCDVDAANLALTANGRPRTKDDYLGAYTASIDPQLCTECGKCEDNCHFEAITDLKVNAIHCEGCGACRLVCPTGAVSMSLKKSGEIFVLDTAHGPMVYADLFPGESNSGKLVTIVRRLAEDLAKSDGMDIVLIDGPPGTGCPAIASVTGVDLILAITEPSLSGEHDLMRLIELARHFSIPICVAINKWDLHPGMSEEIEESCRRQGVITVGRVPYDPNVMGSIKAMRPLPSMFPESPAALEFHRIWKELRSRSKERVGSGLSLEFD